MGAGWQTKKLGEVCSFLNRGISPKYLEDGGVCVLNQKCVRDHAVSYEPSRRHDGKAKAVSAERFVRLGDVLVNSTGTGTLGRVAQVREVPDELTTVDSHVTIVRPISDLFHLDFFGYMLVMIEEQIKEAGEGCGGQTELARSVLAERFTVSYPTSISEQQRIVGILDEAFDGIATAKANAEQNLQNARALFESHLQSVFTQRGEGWVEKQLGEFAAFRNGINFTKSSKGKSIKILGVKDFQNSFWAPLDDLDSVIPDGALPDSDTLQKGDLVFVRSNGNPELIGRCLLIGEVSERVTYSGFTIRARIHAADVSPIYLCHFLKSSVVRRQMIEGGNGANIKSLNQGTLSHLVIPVPPFKQQAKIVRQIEEVSEETQRLESLYQRKLATLDELKKSLLHQAFSGML
ncbi:MAG: restriction endonuclease subunit S [Gallionella sp.]|nr:restriction endonuclease subunit S [Gallionella sp.]